MFPGRLLRRDLAGCANIGFGMLGLALVREPALQGAASGSIYGWEDKVLASIPTTA